MIKVLHINTLGEGGAANSALRLHLGLLEEGVDSVMMCLYKPKNKVQNTTVYEISKLNKINEILFKLKKRLNGERKLEREISNDFTEVFTLPKSYHDIRRTREYKLANIINLHWISGFLNYETFFKYNRKPIVWTFHDMNPFTGGCHYSAGCNLYASECKNCPQLQGTHNPNYARNIQILKKEAISGSERKPVVVTPSSWLASLSCRSLVMEGIKHEVIPYGFDTKKFKFYSKEDVRKELSLSIEKKIVLFVAFTVNSKRKGFEYLQRAIEPFLNNEEVLLCTVGYKSEVQFNSEKIIEFGMIWDEEKLAKIYAASDVFVIPSLEDNLPNTMIESLLCGTPVIGFKVGGIAETIKDGENGFLVSQIDSNLLMETIKKALFFPFQREKIAESSKQKYDLRVQARKYIELYRNIIKG
jgi:glycosyltransferase involved in cell wall biosynthesis